MEKSGFEFEIRAPDDFHCHFRDYAEKAVETGMRKVREGQDEWSQRHRHPRELFGGDRYNRLPIVVKYTARQFARAIAMPNTTLPIVNGAMAVVYKERIVAQAIVDGYPNFEPLTVIYITPETTPEVIFDARRKGVVAGKFYPVHGTTGSDHGIYDFDRPMYPVYEAMQEVGMRALFHGASPNPDIEVFDREAVFLPTFQKIAKDFWRLVMVFEHVSTAKAAHCVNSLGENVFGTITPHHLHVTSTDLLGNGLRPEYYCMPVVQSNKDRAALIQAAVSNNPKFFAGTDSAPHLNGAKYASIGCAGCFTGLHAMELYAEIFEKYGGKDWERRLENFTSHYGAECYDLPLNRGRLTLRRQEWEIPHAIRSSAPNRTHSKYAIRPFRAGQKLRFKVC